ncbi:S-layer protein [Ralstonia sp. CHL-2022]|uniref:S-layer protein n=1 Tax=Ralstonia mojiangensis TaxID=2953895 RepID=A0ABT2L893_9RALS|nr:S-layer protein [Ralstonia mojiangensis]MCT7296523.1 S-layer protein [Ralstonia mojiangensis]MCT7310938.1 S-layer protein [Ralstonia mojiangensis]
MLSTKKTLLAIAVPACMTLGLYACGGSDDPAPTSTAGTSPAPTTPTTPTQPAKPQGMWTTGDLHVHTAESVDAVTPLSTVLDHAFDLNSLDWMAVSNHLRPSPRDATGATLTGGSIAASAGIAKYEMPAIAQAQATGKYAGKLIFSAAEWDMPTHDHLNVGIFDGTDKLQTSAKGLNKFEYFFTQQSASLFDPNDVTAWQQEGPRAGTTHTDVVNAFKWLKTNYPNTSYGLINHPSRNPGKYTVADFREFNDTAPDIMFGIEGMVGNQMEPDRGGYTSAYIDANLKNRTYGGVDYMVAQVGGIWDALLGEGRRVWNFADSDHHFEVDATQQFSSGYYPGEYAKTYIWLPGTSTDLKTLLAAMRSGKSFAVFGDLINALNFTAGTAATSADMGGTLTAKAGDKVTITVRFKSPDHNNYEYPLGSGFKVNMRPVVDHVDLIAGDVTGKAASGTPAYAKDTNDSTKVIATFTKADWKVDADGYNSITYTYTAAKNQYFRLRGTNLGMNVSGETSNGNPLPDQKTVVTENAARFNAINDRNYNDLWFYSNPVFVSVQ